MSRILVTRPRDEGEATAAALAALGHEVLLDPMLTIAPRSFALPSGPFDRVIVTSGNALAALAGRSEAAALRHLPLAVVGRRTGETARGFGFADVAVAGRDVAGLLAHVREAWPPAQRALYLAGADHTMDLAAALSPEGHHVTVTLVYDALAARHFAAPVALALGEGSVDAVLHYSARTAQAFVACSAGILDLAQTRPRHFCLSARVAAVLQAAGALSVAVAGEPREEELFALIGR